jgi:hypothetical protein
MSVKNQSNDRLGANSKGGSQHYKMDVEGDELSYEYKPSNNYLEREMDLKKSLLIDEFK